MRTHAKGWIRWLRLNVVIVVLALSVLSLDSCKQMLTMFFHITYVTGVSLNDSSAKELIGQTLQLTATVFPKDATTNKVTWSSNDSNVASVDQNGLIRMNGTGSAAITVTTVDGSHAATCSVTVSGYGISGTVTISGGSGLSGATVTATKGSTSISATTDSSGDYTMSLTSAGTYTVTSNDSGYAFTPTGSSETVSTTNPEQSGVNFTAVAYRISGSVTSAGGVGLPGVTVTAATSSTSGWATTDSSGAYKISVSSVGIYTVTPTESGYTFNPQNQSATLTNATPDKSGIDFSGSCKTYTVLFDPEGGTPPNPGTIQITCGETYGTLPSTMRSGYSFGGWWTAASGGTQITSSTTVSTTSDQTLYAHWAMLSVTINSFSASANNLTPSGGSVTLSWNASNASTYSVTSSPGLNGLPFGTTAASASVTLPANETSNSITYTFTLTATGSGGSTDAATTTVTVAGRSVLMSVSSSDLSFGSTTVGNSSADSFSISNSSSSNAELTGTVSVTGTGFSIVSGGGSFTLSPGSSRTVSVRFAPPSNLDYSGTVTIDHDATNSSSPTSVSIGGSGFLGAVQNVQATQGSISDYVHVSWSGVTGAASYQVWRSSSPGGSRTLLGTTTSLSFNDATAGFATVYYYYVYSLANGASGNISNYAEGFYPYFVDLKSSQPYQPNTAGLSLSAYFSGVNGGTAQYDTLYTSPPHWVFNGIGQELGFSFSGQKSVDFHVLGSTIDGQSYCYVTIFVNNYASLANQNIFVGSTWHDIVIPASEFGTGANTVDIELQQNPNSSTTTNLWMDRVALGGY